MQRTTRSSQYDTSPRPIGQSFWLLSTMAIAVIIVMAMGEAITPSGGSADGQAYSSEQLLQLADSASATTVTSLPGVATSAGDAGSNATPVPPPAAPATSATTATTAVTADSTLVNTTTSSTAVSETTGASAPGAADAQADTTPTDLPGQPENVGPESIESRGAAALATISYPWEQLLPEWDISFLPEKSGLYGLTMVPERKIEIYIRDGQSTALLAHVIAHELGHAVDVTLNDGPDRRRWTDARDLTGAPWWPGSGATDFSTGAGDFAESFAAWQVGDSAFRSTLGDSPTAAQITLLAELSAG